MKRDNAHDPKAIANQILRICDRLDQKVTLMQLIKLVYLADGWSTALRNRPMSKLGPQAWQYGPVYPTVYKAFKRFGSGQITDKAKVQGTEIEISEEFTPDEDALLLQIVESYGRHHAFRLSEIMHREGTPWAQTVKNQGMYAEIPLDIMAKHFSELRAQRGVEAVA